MFFYLVFLSIIFNTKILVLTNTTSAIRKNNKVLCRHEICQNFYTTRFSGQKFYTQKVRKLGLFLLTIKQQKCINISNLSHFRYNSTVCVKFSVNSHLISVNLELLRKFCKKMRCFLEKFTQLTQILHDRRSRRSRQISTLVVFIIDNLDNLDNLDNNLDIDNDLQFIKNVKI